MPSPECRIRAATQDDLPWIETLYRDAFPDEDLCPLVRALAADIEDVRSLAATNAGADVGHAFFTRCGFADTDGHPALLGPIAVAEDSRGNGIGGTLIRDGMRRLAAEGITEVFVLGDPALYGSFGFTSTGIAPPFPIPADWEPAWQSKPLGSAPRAPDGRLVVPEPWRRPGLWMP